jgi:predicted small lipoprotein YifL
MCLVSLACGKTGALYLPEEPVDQDAEAQQTAPATEENGN